MRYNTERSKARLQNKIYHENTNQKKAMVVILLSDKYDFRTRNITVKEYCVIIKMPIHPEDTILHLLLSCNVASKHTVKNTKINIQIVW